MQIPIGYAIDDSCTLVVVLLQVHMILIVGNAAEAPGSLGVYAAFFHSELWRISWTILKGSTKKNRIRLVH